MRLGFINPTSAPLFAAAAERLPWQADLVGSTGLAYALAGDPAKSLEWFRRGDERGLLSQAEWILYGDLLAAQGEERPALRAWAQSILLHGPSFHALWRLAQSSRRHGDLPLAISRLQQAVELDPERSDAHYLLGLMLLATAPETALPNLMEAARLDPRLDPRVQEIRAELNLAFLEAARSYHFTVAGRSLASLDEWDLAAVAFQNAVMEQGTYAQAWAWLAVALQHTGGDGLPALEWALDLQPYSTSVQGLAGLFWMLQDEPQKALSAYQLAATLEPQNPILFISMWNAAAGTGDLASALDHYLKAIVLNEQDPATWRALALFSLSHGVDVAGSGQIAADRLVSLAPDDWETYDILGQVAFQLEMIQEACFFLEKANELAPDEPAANYHLAEVYLEMGLAALAYDKLVDTTLLDPEGPYGTLSVRLLEVHFP